MRKQAIVCVLLLGAALAFAAPVRAQQIEITEMAGLAQIFGEAQDNDVPLSMNDMDMVSGGYLLYETEVEANGEEAVLAVENIRDYAAVYVGEKRYGELSDTHKELTLALPEGTHKLQLYVENIGRIATDEQKEAAMLTALTSSPQCSETAKTNDPELRSTLLTDLNAQLKTGRFKGDVKVTGPPLYPRHGVPGASRGSHFGGRSCFQSLYRADVGGSDGDLPKRQVQAGFQPRHAAVSQRTPAGFYAGGHQSRNDTGVS